MTKLNKILLGHLPHQVAKRNKSFGNHLHPFDQRRNVTGYFTCALCIPAQLRVLKASDDRPFAYIRLHYCTFTKQCSSVPKSDDVKIINNNKSLKKYFICY